MLANSGGGEGIPERKEDGEIERVAKTTNEEKQPELSATNSPDNHNGLMGPHIHIDDREDSRVLRKIDAVVPQFKIEIMGLSTMYLMTFIMWTLGLAIVVLQVTSLSLFSTVEASSLGTYAVLYESLFGIEGVLRSIGSIILVLLFLTYPQRVILHAYRNFKRFAPMWHQKLIVLMIFLMTITPCFSIFEIVAYWSTFDQRDSELDLPDMDNGSFTANLGVLSFLFSYSDGTVIYNVIMSMVVLSYTWIYFGGVYHFQYLSAKKASKYNKMHFYNRQGFRFSKNLWGSNGHKKNNNNSKNGGHDQNQDLLLGSVESDSENGEEEVRELSHHDRLLDYASANKLSTTAAEDDPEAAGSLLPGQNEEDDEEEEGGGGGSFTRSNAFRRELSTLIKNHLFMDKICYRPRRVLKKHRRRCRKFTGDLPLILLVSVIGYLVILLGFSLGLRMNPSNVPLASLVTVLRICTLNSTDLLSATNEKYVENVELNGGVIPNATIYYTAQSKITSDKYGPCSPSQSDLSVFRRTIAITIFAVCELWLFYVVHRMQRRTHVFLRETPYVSARSEIMGFHFFRNIARVCWGVIMIGGIFSAAINPIEIYLVSEGFLLFNNSTSTFVVNVTIDPMFQVGVGVGTMGFGSFYLMMLLWITYLAYAYLPADSTGIKGWFIGSEWKRGEEALAAVLRRDEYLILVPEERDVNQLLIIRDRQRILETLVSRLDQPQASFIISEKIDQQQQEDVDSSKTGETKTQEWFTFEGGPFRALGWFPTKSSIQRTRFYERLMKEREKSTLLTAITQTRADAPLLVKQIQANLLVLETEILNFHFMHLSYVLAGTKMKDPRTKERVPLTIEEKQALVEDKRFTLLEHVIDVETDTHVMVFSSADRVVVAFRGSVSLTNWQTDFDSSRVVCEYAVNVEPELSDVPPGAIQHAKNVASRPPKVHGGFVKAYETVRARLKELCMGELIGDGSKESKVLFVTGHSLGAGLAVICAVDLGLFLNLPPGRISVTTWGSPKIGNYSFVRRFNRICPSARRFCMVDDPITKLPPDVMFQTIRLTGWWHCGTEILLSDDGNMLIRPTPIERFMLRSIPIGLPQAHLRMTYATSLMLWVVRSHPDYEPDWWASVITLFYKRAAKRLKTVPKNLRDRLMDSLIKSGVTYTYNNKTVRDMMADTSDPFRITLGSSHSTATSTNGKHTVSGRSSATSNGEPVDAEGMITELLVAFRLHQEANFLNTLNALVRLQGEERIFPSAHHADGVAETGVADEDHEFEHVVGTTAATNGIESKDLKVPKEMMPKVPVKRLRTERENESEQDDAFFSARASETEGFEDTKVQVIQDKEGERLPILETKKRPHDVDEMV